MENNNKPTSVSKNKKKNNSDKVYYSRNYKKNQPKNPPMTVEERKAKLEELDKQKLAFAAKYSKLTLGDIKKKETVTYVDYSKEKYRAYITNPQNNEANIRKMSNFLYRVAMPYQRLINHLSSIPCFYWNLTPKIDFSSDKEIDKKKLMTNYHKILQKLNNMAIANEFRKVTNTVVREGVFYGFIYEDNNSFFIHKLDPDYCRIMEMEAGCYNFAFDFSYFKKHEKYLDYMDPSFQSLYKKYEEDTSGMRWQLLDSSKTLCIKFNADNPTENLPAFTGIFEALLDLIDARTLQRNKDEIQNYKLIVQKIPLFDSIKQNIEDDFSLSNEVALKFYSKLADAVPESVGVVLSPMDIDTVDFKPDDNSSELITTYMRSVFSEAGTSDLLFNSAKSGSVGLDASVKTDVAFIWPVVESIERWIQRYIAFSTSGSFQYFFEILRSNIFNKDAECTRELQLANSGVPNKLRLAASNGMNPLHVMSAQFFENDILEVHNNWIPLKTSYTLSGNIEDKNSDANPDPEKDSTADNKDKEGNKEVLDGGE